jgi:cytochrome oxidase Cu insertion factor (SCO1/SenC/PrrC family)
MQMRLLQIMTTRAAVAIGAFVLATGAVASAQEPLPDVDRFGPQVGETVPDFSLVDQFGETRSLQSLMGPDGLMLVFSRSADW